MNPIEHGLLGELGVEHGFGVRGWLGPAGLVRPVQVHGVAVAHPDAAGELVPKEADAVLSPAGGPPVAVVTADCVPVLVAAPRGAAVGAIHAGWRGLAAGVIGEALAEWRRRFGALDGVVAAIGPHARACCYEVDAPVRDAYAHVDARLHARAFSPSRPGHWMADLAALARAALCEGGLDPARVGEVDGACTICDAARFESFRRDGAAAGRLVHAVRPAVAPVGPA